MRRSKRTKTEHPDDFFAPTDRHTSAEANICLTCPYAECHASTCKRYQEEKKKILKGQE